MSLVLDSSATLARLWEDETTDAVRQLFELIRDRGAWVPSLWRLEVANALEMDLRRGRHVAEFRGGALADLALLPIKIDPETDRHAWYSTLWLAGRHRLTLYAAAYLELALRRQLPLATLDRQLRIAAEDEGIELLGVLAGFPTG
ncbi:MAG: type II toxin-antitoxin system VapC family toxin [Candidatus Sulfotelmatobacter sp.]